MWYWCQLLFCMKIIEESCEYYSTVNPWKTEPHLTEFQINWTLCTNRTTLDKQGHTFIVWPIWKPTKQQTGVVSWWLIFPQNTTENLGQYIQYLEYTMASWTQGSPSGTQLDEPSGISPQVVWFIEGLLYCTLLL